VTAGSRATNGRQPRQARKGAAATASVVCRGGAWLSLLAARRAFVRIGWRQSRLGDHGDHVLPGSGTQMAAPKLR